MKKNTVDSSIYIFSGMYSLLLNQWSAVQGNMSNSKHHVNIINLISI